MARSLHPEKLKSRTARLKLAQRREPYWIVMAEGCALGYRRGTRAGTWIARWRDGTGKQHYQSIGPADDHVEGAAVLTFLQAQDAAREWFEVQARQQTTGCLGAGPITVAEACHRYIAYMKAEKKSAQDTELRLAKHVIPELGHRPVKDLTLTELEAWRNSLVRYDDSDPDTERRSKDTANRLLNAFKAALNRLMLDPKNGIVDDRAWRFLKPFHDVGKARDGHLGREQITRLLNITTDGFRNLVAGALLTGCRAGELKAMRVSDFHLDTGTLHVRGGKTGKRDVVLTSEGITFFEALTAGQRPDNILFVRDDGSVWHKSDQHRPMAAAVEAAQLPADTVFYSLRHTYASQSLMAGMNVQLLAENMGTSVGMIEKHYGAFIVDASEDLLRRAVVPMASATTKPFRTVS